MKISKFLLEKFYVFVLGLFVSCIQTMFFVASGSNLDTILFFAVLLWVAIIVGLFIEYKQKVGFYQNLDATLQKVDKKYLIHEMIQEPRFIEGRILYVVLVDLNKNLNDTINAFTIREKEYQEYIELWVHEIKTPLAAGKLIVANNDSTVMRNLDTELNRIDSFVEQALFYARSTSLEKDYVVKEVQLDEIVRKVVKKHKQTFLYKNIKIDLCNLDEKIFSDAKWVEFILNQLIDNALKYTGVDGEIKIYTKKEKENTVLYMKDTGIGIDSRDIERVFERGFTGENGRIYNKATGMGLYLCKLLCEKLYIGIEISSSLEQGTELKLIFPLGSMIGLR
ncbi:sensor histidine kinase [Breznakia sp. OttesenSCG-928-G09]|nr:sensor histidine kinase [Breznakia sp. OttesenSCG-928-G09]